MGSIAAAQGLHHRQPRLALHALGGAVFFGSFFIGPPQIGFGVRAAITLALVGPPRPPRTPDLARGLAQLSLWFLPIGNAWVAIEPTARRAGLHMIFLGCFAALGDKKQALHDLIAGTAVYPKGVLLLQESSPAVG